MICRVLIESVCVCVLKSQGGDVRMPGALSRCSSLSSINTSSGVDVESPSDTASLSAHHLIHRYVRLPSLSPTAWGPADADVVKR